MSDKRASVKGAAPLLQLSEAGIWESDVGGMDPSRDLV